jgi:hypothetical protein
MKSTSTGPCTGCMSLKIGSDIGSGQKQVIQRAMKRRSFNRHPSQRSQRPSWCAKRKGRGSQSEDLRQAEEEVIGSPSTNNCSVPAGSLVKRIVDELVVRNKPRPWRGALPSLRLSPMRWRKQRYDQRRYVLHRTSGSPLPDHACRSCHRHNLRARIRGPILDLGKADQGVIKGIQISKQVQSRFRSLMVGQLGVEDDGAQAQTCRTAQHRA